MEHHGRRGVGHRPCDRAPVEQLEALASGRHDGPVAQLRDEVPAHEPAPAGHEGGA